VPLYVGIEGQRVIFAMLTLNVVAAWRAAIIQPCTL